ncbi:hypothetical protein [Sulfurimonas sp. HSL3-7]|uniref:hypothetical protein n=1 Tax=Sulfonitrofixus jiaomeiensis TaxID=3131938 RepID=UPI0031FA0D40
MPTRSDRWEVIYRTTDTRKVGWYQAVLEILCTLLQYIMAAPKHSFITSDAAPTTYLKKGSVTSP